MHAGPFYQTTVWLTQFKIHIQHLFMYFGMDGMGARIRDEDEEEEESRRMDDYIFLIYGPVSLCHAHNVC